MKIAITINFPTVFLLKKNLIYSVKNIIEFGGINKLKDNGHELHLFIIFSQTQDLIKRSMKYFSNIYSSEKFISVSEISYNLDNKFDLDKVYDTLMSNFGDEFDCINIQNKSVVEVLDHLDTNLSFFLNSNFDIYLYHEADVFVFIKNYINDIVSSIDLSNSSFMLFDTLGDDKTRGIYSNVICYNIKKIKSFDESFDKVSHLAIYKNDKVELGEGQFIFRKLLKCDKTNVEDYHFKMPYMKKFILEHESFHSILISQMYFHDYLYNTNMGDIDNILLLSKTIYQYYESISRMFNLIDELQKTTPDNVIIDKIQSFNKNKFDKNKWVDNFEQIFEGFSFA